MINKQYHVYILANESGMIYVGMTNDLIKRIWQHKNKLVDGYTKKHDINRLVWFDSCGDVNEAIAHEKRIKKWRREYKENIINESNPDWKDLYPVIIQ